MTVAGAALSATHPPTLCVAAKIEGGESHAGDFELFRGCGDKEAKLSSARLDMLECV